MSRIIIAFLVTLGFLIGSMQSAPSRDCTASCLFSGTYKIWQNHTLASVYLSRTFDLSFDFQMAEIPGPVDGTILSMSSKSKEINSQPLLVAIVAGTNILRVYHDSVEVIKSGPSVNIGPNQWTTVIISLGYETIKVSVGSNSISGLLTTPAKPGVFSDLFISNPSNQAVIGNIRRIKITGPLCCAQTSYYQSDWQSCGNAADYTTANPVQSCGTCLSYSCIDWVVGSQAMVQREQEFLRETNESVTFAVGSFGSDNSRAGLCYRITSDQASQDIIAQVIDGGDSNNFNIMQGAGGLGAIDSCLLGNAEINGPTAPMFYGEPKNWGNYAGGIISEGDCLNVNAYPICRPNAPDNMEDLCRESFRRFLRLGIGNTNNSSPRIHNICQVKCPRQLYTATGLHRLDEPSDMFVCSANQTQTIAANRLERYLDCQRPDYADASKINGTVDPLYQVVVPCRRDGYSRINGLPPVPTLNPTPEPSPVPTFEPTPVPTMDNMCCLTSNYASGNWQGCSDSSDPALGSISSCENCAAYACLDWLPGSTDMMIRERTFYSHTLDSVYFGVGSFGADKSKGGLCYRIKTNTLDRDIIMQVVATDSGDGNVHLMSADGGANSCTLEGSSIPMFMSTEEEWGDIFNGVSIRDQCSLIPEGPYCSQNPRDNMQDLCRWAFDSGLRGSTSASANPKISSMCEVACPSELFSATGVLRSDRNLTEQSCVANSFIKTKSNAEVARYMDCAKPQFAWEDIIQGQTDPSYPIVVPCRRDGYARVNTVPTMPPTVFPSYMPTPSIEPTAEETDTPTKGNSASPTVKRTSSLPTIVPSFAPSLNSLCCADYVYQDSLWPTCNNAADKTIKSVTSCSTCMSYQCLDWNALSNGMKAREASYFAEGGDKVYFGVGSYGADMVKAGLCYRMSVAGVDRDLIVQVITSGTAGAAGNFNLMMSDGGLGVDLNACTAQGSALPQFLGNSSLWGGAVNESGCDNIPEYPFCSGVRQDNMRTLCKQSFEVGLRIANNPTNSNPTISKMCQVKCPRSLWTATGLHRSDESSTSYQCSNALEPVGGTLSRSMNCAKPAYAWSNNIVGATFNGSAAVVPCRRDGYTRINSKPSAMPTPSPTISPTKNNTLCCSSTAYADYEWPYCKNPADATLSNVPSCAAENCLAYQCIDWNVLSSGMTQREKDYFKKTKDSVYFGVGSYGNDPTRAGLCYRIQTAEISRDLIVQVITQGGSTPDGSFNLMMADGGFSDQYTACSRVGSMLPMYSGPSAQWGGQNGGWADVTGCDSLPQYPICSSSKNDNMRQLCRATFDKNFRLLNVSNSQPHITNMCQVACPSQLWQATGLRRADEGTNSFKCGAKVEPSGGLLSRSMDCAKPTYAWGPIKGLTYNRTSLVIPCRRDGYTRINTVASSQPTTTPTVRPTRTAKPTVVITAAPSIDPLCCPYFSYADVATWQTCNNAASPSLGRVGSCATCLAYQCIDWTAGSQAMKAREATFLNRTGLNVHFGVGSYSNDPTRGGNCYRISVQGVKLDLIVQAINQGAPAADGNFEMLLGDGGFTGNQACIIGSGANVPMYPGNASMWGQNYGYNGGWNSYFGCKNLPRFPICGDSPQDDLRDLCRWSFSTGLRFVTGRPYITSMCQVACPVELYSATGIHRLDEPTTSHSCGTVISGGGNLNRMMDCGKPSFAWKGSAQGKLDPDYPMVVPCKRDGYARINEVPVYPPSEEPTTAPTYTAEPTPPSTIKPTMRPSNATNTVAQAQDKSNPLFALLSGTKNLSIASAILFVILVLLIIFACEFSLRRTRHRQLLVRVEEKRRLVAENNNQRRAELLQELNAPTPVSSAIELRRTYSAYQKINRTLLSNDQTDIVM